MILLEAKNLTLGYEGQVVTRNINFRVEEGDYLCITGDNGAGKSTLVKAILSLHSPFSGSLDFNIERNSIGYLPQSSHVDSSFPTNVGEVVLSGNVSRLGGKRFFYTREERMRSLDNLEKMGVLDLRRKSFQTLSGGQRQRVLLARALTAASRVLLLDEPAAGLDVHTSSELYSLIDSLNHNGMTIIMVTHDIHPALNSATRILHLGQSIFFASRDEFFSSPVGKKYLEEAGHHD